MSEKRLEGQRAKKVSVSMKENRSSGDSEKLVHPDLLAGSEIDSVVKGAWNNGEIAIKTWTLPSGDVPIVTLIPASQFVGTLEMFQRPGMAFDNLAKAVRNSVATEGEFLHDDLVLALAYTLLNHSAKAKGWWLSVGIVHQGIIVEEEYMPVRGAVRYETLQELVHPSWDIERALKFDGPPMAVN